MTGFPFDYLPPEIQVALQQQADHERMHTVDNTHAVKQLLDDLNEDQLRALDLIIKHVSKSEATAGYFRGKIEMIQQIKFDKCPCGDEHDPDKMEFEPPTEPNAATVAEAVSEFVTNASDEELDPIHRMLAGEDEDDTEVLKEARALYDDKAALMAEYGVEANPDHGLPPYAEEYSPQPLRCVRCGKGYPSLEDRMLRKPDLDGCGGCQEKSAWG